MAVTLRAYWHGVEEAYQCQSVTDAIGLAVGLSAKGRQHSFRIYQDTAQLFPRPGTDSQPIEWGKAWDQRALDKVGLTFEEADLIADALLHQRRRFAGRYGRLRKQHPALAESWKAWADLLLDLVERLRPLTGKH
jgi:hypothetical protein